MFCKSTTFFPSGFAISGPHSKWLHLTWSKSCKRDSGNIPSDGTAGISENTAGVFVLFCKHVWNMDRTWNMYGKSRCKTVLMYWYALIIHGSLGMIRVFFSPMSMIHTSSILFQALWRLWRQNAWWRDFTPGPNMRWSDYGSITGTWPPLVNLQCLDVLTIQTMPKWSEDIWPNLVSGSISIIHYKLQNLKLKERDIFPYSIIVT